MKKLISIISLCFLYTSLGLSQTYYISGPDPVTWDSGDEIFADEIVIYGGGELIISSGEYSGTHLIVETINIEAGGTFRINPRAAATITSIVNNGTLILDSFTNEPGVASLIHYGYSGTGMCRLNLYLPGGTTPDGNYIWHYISTPIAGITSASFNTLDLAQYVESYATSTENGQGWIALDGYQYSSGSKLTGYAFETLDLMKGYNYYSASGSIVTLSGTINIAPRTTPALSYSGPSEYQGFNLIGNPFAASLDWIKLTNGGGLQNVNNAIYFTNRGSYPSYVNGIGTLGATQYIPPLQGFFVQANASGGRVRFYPTFLEHHFDQMRYKKGDGENSINPDTISFIRLQLKKDIDSTDIVVRFNNKASSKFDGMFDAYRFSISSGDINIWTTTEDIDYSINGLPFPKSKIEIPIGINLTKAGTFKLSSNEIKQLDNYAITLKDLSTNTSIDLKKGQEMVFDAPLGITENRFILSIANLTTDIPTIITPERKFSIYSSHGNLNILTLSDEFGNLQGSVTIYDLTGRKILQVNNLEWNGNGDLKQFAVNPAENGMFIVEVKAGNKKYVEKVNINR